MSAEAKKKRGDSGRAKALANPFRLNGWAPDWEARKRGCHQVGSAQSSGSTTMRGVYGGIMAELLGYRMPTVQDRIVNHALDRVTHPILSIEDERRAAA